MVKGKGHQDSEDLEFWEAQGVLNGVVGVGLTEKGDLRASKEERRVFREELERRPPDMSISWSRCVQGVVLRPAPGQCRDRCWESGFYAQGEPVLNPRTGGACIRVPITVVTVVTLLGL